MVADALSHILENSSSTLLLLSVPCFTFLEELKSRLARDSVFQQLRQDISDNPKDYPEYVITQNLILRKGHIWLPQGFPFIQTLLTKYHSTPTRGHMGVAKT